jgi:hypothetical protein
VALVVLAQPRWFPVMDLAAIELRLRDISEGHPPLVGMAGRIYGYDLRGSHPGPLMFWSLYPFYRLFGGTAWAMQAATAALNLVAISLAVWIGYRRGGRTGALAVALGAMVLVHVYGTDKLTTAWNPYLPVLWWPVFLLAAWSVSCHDTKCLPVAGFAATFCVQTHYSYLGLVGAVSVVVAASPAWSVRWRRPSSVGVRMAAATLVLLAVAWTPTIIDQLHEGTGNLTILREQIVHPQEPPLLSRPDGLRRTISIGLAHLNVGELARGTRTSIVLAPTGPLAPGIILLALWAAAAATAWRRRRTQPDLARLHLVVGAAVLAGFGSIGRISGDVLDYLSLWGWATTVMATGAIIWTVAAVRATRNEPRLTLRPVLLGLLLVGVTAFSIEAVHTPAPIGDERAQIVRYLAPDTIAALRGSDAPGGGTAGHYLLSAGEDALALGMSNLALFLELDRQGFDVGIQDQYSVELGGDHRVMDPSEATAAIHLIIGSDAIARWRDTPAAQEVAYHEPRTALERAEYDRLHDEVAEILRDAGRSDLVDLLDRSVGLTMFAKPPAEALPKLQRMLDIGLPGAVFIAPVGVFATT